ncbi:MAG: RsmB/NOP family class I SAM-dependent RNA methyltransferase [Asticcacaulis sp.]|nr:RsmB/NOP family class I SAM-dependent RNA methyltransferase [Asticcacaulis sp.]
MKSDLRAGPSGSAATALPTGSVRLVPRGQIERLDGYLDGAWWVQDAAAALSAVSSAMSPASASPTSAPRPAARPTNFAAAGAHVTAVDISPARLERLASNLARLGLHAEIVVADLAGWQPEALFDAVLLDAPCSATGTIRRHPDVVRLKGPDDIAALANPQASLLLRAAGWVAPGGTLVYCTCSLEPEEGELQTPSSRKAPCSGACPWACGGDRRLRRMPDGGRRPRTLPFHLPATEERRGGLGGIFAAQCASRANS